MEILIRTLLEDQKNVQEKLQEAQNTINRINILE